jgi:hypothetical protein
MAEGIPARLTPSQARAQGRKFGLTVGIAFLVLAGIASWRGSQRLPMVFGAIGVALVLGALLLPAQLLPVERAWMAMAHLMSKVTTPVFMGLLYFLGFTPIGRVKQMVSGNSLVRPKTAGSYWVERAPGDRRGDLERQF